MNRKKTYFPNRPRWFTQNHNSYCNNEKGSSSIFIASANLRTTKQKDKVREEEDEKLTREEM